MRFSMRKTIMSALLVALSAASSTVAAQDRSEEYQLKARLLSRLVNFVSWGDRENSDPVVFCVVGDNPFDDSAMRVMGENGILALPLKEPPENLGRCDIAFFSESKTRSFQALLPEMKELGILTISDIPRFANAGGMINMTFANRRIGFLINKDEADAAGINLSYQLLSLAEIVDTRG